MQLSRWEAKLRSNSGVLGVLVLWLVWRLSITLVALLAGGRFSAQHPFLHLWVQWDSYWYLDIAQNGYTSLQPVAFFPLYPLLTRLTATLLGCDYALGALIVSQIALVVAILYFYALVRQDNSQEVAQRAVFYLLIFPAAIFFAAVFSESLLLAASFGCLYHLRRGQYGWSGIWGYFAALSRPTGALLVLLWAWEYLAHRGWRVKKIGWDVGWGALIPLGTATYMAYTLYRFGDALAFASAKSYWGEPHGEFFGKLGESWIGMTVRLVNIIQQPIGLMMATLMVVGLGVGIWALASHRIAPLYFGCAVTGLAALAVYASPRLYSPQAIAHLMPVDYGLFIAFLLLGVIVTFRLRTSYGLYMLLLLAVAASTFTLWSMNRYLLTAFPAFILLARWGQNRLFDLSYSMFSLLGLGLFIVLFVNGHWVG